MFVLKILSVNSSNSQSDSKLKVKFKSGMEISTILWKDKEWKGWKEMEREPCRCTRWSEEEKLNKVISPGLNNYEGM